MIFIIGVAFLVGFLLILATSLSKEKRFDGIGQIESEQALPFKHFIRLCQALTESLKLEVDNIEWSEEDQVIDIYAHSPTPITGSSFLIHGVLKEPHQEVAAAELLDVSSSIIQDRISKGIFITNTRFTVDLPTISELAPMEFIDGNKLQELAQQYKIPITT